MTLILIGLRGSGKTTVGRLAAGRLGVPFVDLDDLTPGLLGFASVAQAWAGAGEPAFRQAETRALRQALAGPAGVVALGGGTPTAPGAADVVLSARRAGAEVVYLRARPETLRARLASGDLSQRPALTGGDVLGEIEAVFAARDPLYRALASRVVDTDGLSAEAAADALLAGG